MKIKAFSISLLALILAFTSCGGEASSSSSSSLIGTSSSFSSSSLIEEEGWDDLVTSKMKSALFGYVLPYIDLSSYSWDFQIYEGYSSLEIEGASYSLLEEYSTILEEENFEVIHKDLASVSSYEYMYEEAHLFFQLYLDDKKGALEEESKGKMHVDCSGRVAISHYPKEEIETLIRSLAHEKEILFPDLSIFPSEDYYLDNQIETNAFFEIQWTGILDTVTPDQISSYFAEDGWTLEENLEGYYDPSKSLIAYTGEGQEDKNTYVRVEMLPMTSLPNEQLSLDLGVSISLPNYPSFATYKIISQTDLSPYQLIISAKEGIKLESWEAVLEKEGFTFLSLENDIHIWDSPEGSYILECKQDSVQEQIIVTFFIPQETYSSYPRPLIARYIHALGAVGATLPDLSAFPTKGSITTYDGVNRGYFQIYWDQLDGDFSEELIAFFLDNGWVYRVKNSLYVDSTKQLGARIMFHQNGQTLVQIQLAGEEALSSWPEDNFEKDLRNAGLAGSLPTLEGENISEVFSNYDPFDLNLDIVAAYLSQEEYLAYLTKLEEAGFKEVRLGDADYNAMFTIYVHDEFDLALSINCYDDNILRITADKISRHYRYNKERLQDELLAYGNEKAVSVPSASLEGAYAYLDTSFVNNFHFLSLTVGLGNYIPSIVEELLANNWVKVEENEIYIILIDDSEEENVFRMILSYDEKNMITQIRYSF